MEHPKHDEAAKAVRDGLAAAGFDVKELPSLVHRLIHDLSEYVATDGDVDPRFWADMQSFAARQASRMSWFIG